MKGWTKIALMTTTDASGQDAERGIQEVLSRAENAAVKLVENVHFNPSDVSVAAQIERIRASAPDAFIAWTTGAPVAGGRVPQRLERDIGREGLAELLPAVPPLVDPGLDPEMEVLIVAALGVEAVPVRSTPDKNAIFNSPVALTIGVKFPARRVNTVE